MTFGNRVFQVTWGLFTPTTLYASLSHVSQASYIAIEPQLLLSLSSIITFIIKPNVFDPYTGVEGEQEELEK